MTSEDGRGIGIRSWLSGQKPKTKTPEETQVILDKHRIAVLPFSNISPDPKDEYFADGLTEELISTISTMHGIRVISRTSAMNYKNTSKKLFEIGRELNIGVAIEGSVRKAGNNVRIIVQLIDAKTDEHLWADSYNRQLDDIFAIQTEIAKQIAKALSIRLGEPETERLSKVPTENTAAYQDYLMAKHIIAPRSEEAIRKAVQYLEKATKVDPNFAEAWATLAAANLSLGTFSFTPYEESGRIALELANRALEKDPDSATAHAVRGEFFLYHAWNFEEAEKELRTSLALNPSLSYARRVYSRVLATLGRVNEGVLQMELAVEQDPLDPPSLSAEAISYVLAGSDEDAWNAWMRSRELFPDYNYALVWKAFYLMRHGRFEEVDQELAELKPSVLEEPYFKMVRGHLYGREGRKEEAMRILKELRMLVEKGHASTDHVAYVYAGMGDMDTFFKWMIVAIEKRHVEPMVLKNYQRVFPPEIAEDPRWKIMQKMGGIP